MYFDEPLIGKTETKPDVFSLESLIAWLEKQPGDSTYNWDCCEGGCLIGIYSAKSGVDFYECHSRFYDRKELHIACDEPRTFGAALSRARTASQGQG